MATPQAIVYLLGLITSGVCAILLVRSYLDNRTRLLLFSAGCFIMLAINNLLVVADLLVFPDMSLLFFRQLAALIAVSILLFGFVWDTE